MHSLSSNCRMNIRMNAFNVVSNDGEIFFKKLQSLICAIRNDEIDFYFKIFNKLPYIWR